MTEQEIESFFQRANVNSDWSMLWSFSIVVKDFIMFRFLFHLQRQGLWKCKLTKANKLVVKGDAFEFLLEEIGTLLFDFRTFSRFGKEAGEVPFSAFEKEGVEFFALDV